MWDFAAAELHRTSTTGEDALGKYIKIRLRLRHAERLQSFVGANPEEQQQNLQDTLLLADDDKRLAELHSSAKEVMASMPKLQRQ
jgi:hypothetical protein